MTKISGRKIHTSCFVSDLKNGNCFISPDGQLCMVGTTVDAALVQLTNQIDVPVIILRTGAMVSLHPDTLVMPCDVDIVVE